jgi:hypothetical protein
MAKQPRSEAILIRFTADDKAAITRAAEREGISREEFIRSACLAYMALRLNGHALRAALRGGVELLKEFEEEGRSQFFAKKVKA